MPIVNTGWTKTNHMLRGAVRDRRPSHLSQYPGNQESPGILVSVFSIVLVRECTADHTCKAIEQNGFALEGLLLINALLLYESTTVSWLHRRLGKWKATYRRMNPIHNHSPVINMSYALNSSRMPQPHRWFFAPCVMEHNCGVLQPSHDDCRSQPFNSWHRKLKTSCFRGCPIGLIGNKSGQTVRGADRKVRNRRVGTGCRAPSSRTSERLTIWIPFSLYQIYWSPVARGVAIIFPAYIEVDSFCEDHLQADFWQLASVRVPLPDGRMSS